MSEQKNRQKKKSNIDFLFWKTGYFENLKKALIEMGHHDYVFWLLNHFLIILIRFWVNDKMVSLRFYSEKNHFKDMPVIEPLK